MTSACIKFFTQTLILVLAAGLSAACAFAQASKRGAAPTDPVREGTIKLTDSDIEYFSQGHGQAIVLLPGAGLTVGYMETMAQTLADSGYRAVRINPRGAGKSTGAGEGTTLHTLAADVAGVIEVLKLGPSHVAGHAFGNRVARTLAADRPDLVRGVILFAAGGKVPPRPAAAAALQTINPASSEAVSYLVGSRADVQKIQQIITPCLAPVAGGIAGTAQQNAPLADWWAPPGKTYFLVLQGTEDQIAPPENGELLKRELGARVTLVPIPGAGHLMFLEEPQKTATAVLSFLKKDSH